MKSLFSFLSYVALGLTCVAQVPEYLPTDGLIAWYPFNGNTNDESGRENHGVLNGGTWIEDRNGQGHSALFLDGIDDFIEIPNSNQLNFAENVSFTVAFWWQPGPTMTHSGFNGIIGKSYPSGTQPGRGWQLGITGSEVKLESRAGFSFSNEWDNPSCGFEFPFAPSQLDAPSLVVLEFNKELLQNRLFVNGVEWANSPCDNLNQPMDNSHPLLIGLEREQNFHSSGHFDDVGIWNRVLSADEISMLLTGQAASSVPEYVPSEGLVAWWGMDGNGEDSHTGTHDATNLTATPAADRFGNDNGALMFSGSDEMRGPGGGDMDAGLSNAITLSCWLNANQFAQNQGTGVFRHSPSGVSYNWALHLSTLGDDSNSNHPYFLAGQSLFENNGGNISNFAIQLDEWHHVVLRVVDGLVDMHVDGVEVFSNQTNGSFQTTSNAEFVFGSTNNTPANDNFIGLMDDVGVWNRGISDAEILALYQVQSSIMGCTDETACNFNPEATVDDESCFESPFIAAFGVDAESVSTCSGESISLTADGTTSAVDSTLLDSFTMTVNSYYSRTTPILESGHTYRLIGNGRYGFADGWSHNDPAWNYAWDQETGTKVYCNGTQDASEDVRWLYDGAANFQRPDNDYHNNDNNAFCNGSDKTYTWTIEGDGNAHVISWEDCCYGDNSGSLDFWLYELTGVPGGPETTWSTGDQGATTELTPSESQWVTLTTMLDGVSLCQDSIWIEVVTSGCNDQNACNYSMLDVCSVDCIFPLVGEDCEAGAVACAAGTVWDAVSQTCVVATPAYLNEPGETAILNPCYFDSNGNGLVEVTDLMNVLSVYGLACGEISEAAFSCGGPLEYQGYDYETVQIGEQCWFAENARYLPSVSPPEMGSVTEPHAYVFGYSGNDVSEAELLNGAVLYNGITLAEWDICPSGWHVPSEIEWQVLESLLGMSQDEIDIQNSYRGNQASALKSGSEGWQSTACSSAAPGTNEFGFGAEPVGIRHISGGGTFTFNCAQTTFWTSTDFSRRALAGDKEGIYRSTVTPEYGFSVRCMKDAE